MSLMEGLLRPSGALGFVTSAYNTVMHSHRIFIPVGSHVTDCLQADVDVF